MTKFTLGIEVDSEDLRVAVWMEGAGWVETARGAFADAVLKHERRRVSAVLVDDFAMNGPSGVMVDLNLVLDVIDGKVRDRGDLAAWRVEHPYVAPDV